MQLKFRKIFLCFSLIIVHHALIYAQLPGEVNDIHSPENRYFLLLNQVQIHAGLDTLKPNEKELINEADDYAKRGEFEIAIVYLEETLASLQRPNQTRGGQLITSLKEKFSISILSGVDFNRQEFEIGYLESDSTILEEIDKPYVGIRVNYIIPTGIHSNFEISNEIRYDQENRRNNYKLGWRNENQFILSYSGFWNESDILSSNSFWEHEIEARITSGWFESLNWSFYIIYTLKDYKNSGTYISDFYRNRFNAYLEWNLPSTRTISIELLHELNESLGKNDNDYAQASVLPAYRHIFSEKFNIRIQSELLIRDYKLEYEDSTITNRYLQYGTEFLFEIPIYSPIRIEFDNDLYFKKYREKSTLEPDYFWNILRNSIIFDLSASSDIGIGYEWEIKRHKKNSNGSYDVTEQDYHAHGISLLMNYFTMTGMYISATLSYQWRRYPASVTNDLFSIYSDRNIFSIMLMTFIPLTENLSMNGFITYDNDKDIDLDQQNNQSIIFTAELEYKL